ncbi:hypothetical protein OR1_03912 [Geobacter sp. OR-1]|uniref:DUF4124 domain-containing protein n=1 Tax=Geobacter sp. OR-1 TaxID=1266765 RepID=UPI000541B938|nr:DUF4124 domain-containing protein [Geobacter sp. OR-1]GAM11596.1 hypothetical protein OR1_03912 [Geobacter sp. OR-1]
MKLMALCLLVFLMQMLIHENDSIAAMYKWEDSSGVVHFSDDPASIPAKFRNRVKNLEPKEVEIPSDTTTETTVKPEQNELQQPSRPETSGLDKGKEYWQVRYQSILGEMTRLKDGLKGKREQMNEYRRKWLVTQRRVERQAFNQMENEINQDEERIKELEKNLEALDVEAARNAVPFEWRR